MWANQLPSVLYRATAYIVVENFDQRNLGDGN